MKKNLFIAAAAMLMLVACSNGAKKECTKEGEKTEMCTKAEKENCSQIATCEMRKPCCNDSTKCDKEKACCKDSAKCDKKKPCCKKD